MQSFIPQVNTLPVCLGRWEIIDNRLIPLKLHNPHWRMEGIQDLTELTTIKWLKIEISEFFSIDFYSSHNWLISCLRILGKYKIRLIINLK